ncbi:MAG TPA: hypothetical protein VFI45_17565 [Candidatus Acidoferrum sp.]|nr:hypothetical protein [Candidatus Acidoferrum sp.]
MSFRRPILFMLGMLLAAAPLLTCLPTPAMTDAEMACCKKMAGNCDMGTGNHSCCKTTASVAQSFAMIAQHQQVPVPPVLVAVSTLFTDSSADIAVGRVPFKLSPIPISPPGFETILRI